MQGLGARLFQDIPPELMREMMEKNSSLRGYIQGYAAEEFLMKQLRQDPDFTEVAKIPDQASQKGDISCLYKQKPLTIEVKSILATSRREEILEGGFSGVVLVRKTDRGPDTEFEVGTSHLKPGQFDILAISTYGITGEWGYYFMANKYLPRVSGNPNKIKTSMGVNVTTTPFLYADIYKAIEDLS